jgi:CRP-like cAMP-binding protein
MNWNRIQCCITPIVRRCTSLVQHTVSKRILVSSSSSAASCTRTVRSAIRVNRRVPIVSPTPLQRTAAVVFRPFSSPKSHSTGARTTITTHLRTVISATLHIKPLAAHFFSSQKASSSSQQSRKTGSSSPPPPTLPSTDAQRWRPGFGYWWVANEQKQRTVWQRIIDAIGLFLRRHREVRIFGRTLRFSLTELAGHMSFLLLGLSFAFHDILWLRSLALGAGGCMMIFNFWHPYAGTLWLPLKWNTFFLATNLVHILYLLAARYQANNLSEEERHLYNLCFASTHLNTVDYMRLVRAGEFVEIKDGHYLTREQTHNSYVYLIAHGSAKVYVDGKCVYELNEGQFIGEMGLHVGLRISDALQSTASVVSDGPMSVLAWTRGTLIDVVEQNPEIATAVQATIAADLVRKALERDNTLNPNQNRSEKVRLAREKARHRRMRLQKLQERTFAQRRKIASAMRHAYTNNNGNSNSNGNGSVAGATDVSNSTGTVDELDPHVAAAAAAAAVAATVPLLEQPRDNGANVTSNEKKAEHLAGLHHAQSMIAASATKHMNGTDATVHSHPGAAAVIPDDVKSIMEAAITTELDAVDADGLRMDLLMAEEQDALREEQEQQLQSSERWMRKDHDMYRKLLRAVLADGKVTDYERRTLERFRNIHFINPAIHDQVLDEVGWTSKEYEDGVHDMTEAELQRYKTLRQKARRTVRPAQPTDSGPTEEVIDADGHNPHRLHRIVNEIMAPWRRTDKRLGSTMNGNELSVAMADERLLHCRMDPESCWDDSMLALVRGNDSFK